MLLGSFRPLGALVGSFDRVCFIRETKPQDHNNTYIHKACTSTLKSGRREPDFKIQVHVVWMCVLPFAIALEAARRLQIGDA